jgi:murein L,D-transpeptidase YafK
MTQTPGPRSGQWAAWRALTLCVLTAATAASDVAAMSRQPMAKGIVTRTLRSSEAMLAQSLISIRENRLHDALRQVDALLQIAPNFRLAQLIKGDLLLAHARPLSTLGDVARAPSARLSDLRAEALTRLQRYHMDPPRDVVPKYLVQLLPQQKHALIVDTAKSTLYVLENDNGHLRYATDFYITVGRNGIDKLREGDKKTPLGVYHVTSQLPQKKLTDFYGAGAYPIDYPNEWDQREGRKGHGIWLHGTPRDTYSRPPRASDGCVVLANDDLTALGQLLQPGLTPVIIANGVDWVPPVQTDALRSALTQQLERWRQDWESRNLERYLAHYAASFSDGRANLRRWSRQKRAAFTGKASVKVRLTDVTIFLYPGREDLAVVDFTQSYSAGGVADETRKRQYWVQENGVWKIAYEGAV